MKVLILAKIIGYFIQIHPVTSFKLHDFTKLNENQHILSINFNDNEEKLAAVFLQNLDNSEEDVTCDLENRLSEVSSVSCELELTPGRWKLLEAESLTILNVDAVISQDLEFDNLKSHFRSLRDERRKKREIEAEQEWVPRVTSISPTSLSADRSGQRVEIFGGDLFPKHLDPLSGEMMEIYFYHGETEQEFPCNLNAYWSSDERLICTTTMIPASASDYKIRLRYLDSETQSMQDAVMINRNVYDQCSSSCRTYFSANTDSTMRLFTNRFVNGDSDFDSSFYSEWMNSSDSEYHHNKQVDGYIYKNEFTKKFRLENCPNPIGIEVREKTSKIDVDLISGVVFDLEPTIFPERYFWKLNPDSNYTIENGNFNFEFRFKCDRNVQTVFGYMSNQKLPSTDSPTEGISIPKLVSSKNPEDTVGMCVFKHNSEKYPASIPEGERSTGWVSLTCKTLVDSDFHGGVNFLIETDKNADFATLPQDTGLDSDLWLFSNDLESLYNSYIAPAITSVSKSKGSKYGGYEITISGNKFTEQPQIKVGFQECKVLNFNLEQVICELENYNSSCPVPIYPGNPGLTGTLYNSKLNGNNLEYIFDYDGDFGWSSRIEDGWASASAKSAGSGWYVENKHSSKEGADMYTLKVDGWFVAPRSGFYRFTSNGDDSHVVQYNSENESCALDRSIIHWKETENSLTASGWPLAANQLWDADKHDGAWNVKSISEKVFELKKGDQIYIRGALTEHNNVDFMQIGAIYLGDRFETNEFGVKHYKLPQNIVIDQRFFVTEKQKYEVTQTPVFHEQLIKIENQTETVENIEIFYNDGVRARSVSFDPRDSEDEIKNQIYDGLFKTTCVYDDTEITPWLKLEYEQGMLWPYHAPTKTDNSDKIFPNFQSVETFCGHSHYESTPTGGVHWRYLFRENAANNQFPGSIDIIQDSHLVNALCFAYYGRVDVIHARTRVVGMNGGWSNYRRWEFNVNLESDRWVFKCLDLKQMYNDHSLMASKTASGIEGLQITNIEIKEMWAYNLADENGESKMVLDDTMLAFVDKDVELIEGPVREAGIGMSDGRGISDLLVNKISDTEIKLSFRRNHNSALKPDENILCGWQVPELEILKINQQNPDSFDVVTNEISQPSQGWFGKISIGGVEFEASTATVEEIKNIYKELGFNVDVSFNSECSTSYGINVNWLDLEIPNVPFVNLTGLISDGEVSEGFSGQTKPAGVWIQRATPNMLREASEVPKITMNVGDSAVLCYADNDCEFELQESEHEIISVVKNGNYLTVTLNQNLDVLEIEGVFVGNKICENVSVVDTEISCELPNDICGGENIVKVKKQSFGYISGFGVIDVAFQLNSITPNSGSASGGTKVTLAGAGFCSVENMARFEEHFFINGEKYAPNSVEIISGNEMILSLPKLESISGTKMISLSGSSSVSFNFQQISVITEVSSDINIFGGTVDISGTGFKTVQGKSSLTINGQTAEILSWSDTFISGLFDNFLVGSFPVELDIEDSGLAIGNFSIDVVFEVHQIYPESSGFFGGEEIEIHGEGFGNNQDMVEINIGVSRCTPISVSNNLIKGRR